MLKFTNQEFIGSNDVVYKITPTFYKVKIKAEYESRLTKEPTFTTISVPIEDISTMIDSLRRIEREYKAYRVLKDLIAETKLEMNKI